MSADALIWLIEGCLFGLFLLLLVAVPLAQSARDWWRRRGAPRRLAVLDAEMERRRALRSLTDGDRAWLASMGWRQ